MRNLKAPVLVVLTALLFHVRADGLTVEVASGGGELVRAPDTWRFFRGKTDPSAPITDWKGTDFDDTGWESGPGGFGYKYTAGIGTTLSDMRNGYLTVFVRRTFDLAGPLPAGDLELVVDYDDGFAAYLNGGLVAWRSLSLDPATAGFDRTAPGISHTAGAPETIVLGKAADLLQEGKNVLAIECHNNTLDSSDLALVPTLRVIAGEVTRDGALWVVESPAQTLRGAVSSPLAASVTAGGQPASFDPVLQTWHADVVLSPGRNHLAVETLDAGGAVLESAAADVLYISPENHFAGTVAGDTTWPAAAGGVVVEGTLVVPAGATLTIEPGIAVYMKAGAVLQVLGKLLAEGTEADPIRFTRFAEGTRWKRIFLIESTGNRLAHVVIEFADSVGEHQDYYVPGPRNYHEAVVLLASSAEFEDCLFRNLPDDAPGGEGDALAVISDDAGHPGPSSATFRACRFISIGQGIHTRFSYVLVEDCFFQGKNGDNDDVDLWGESDPPPLIRRNRFALPVHEDRINPTRCSAVIVGNFIEGSTDHGIVLRDKCSPVVMNNVVLGCPNGGIVMENSCTALLVNNTIANCGRGLRLFDLGRWDPPYSLNPGGGTARVVNCIIRNCTQTITLEDSPNTTIADRGSHVTVISSDVERGRAGVSVSGAASTVEWGAGNIDVDPRFAAPAALDFHLLAGSPAIDAGTAAGAPSDDLDGSPRPCGAGVDLGAYEDRGCTAPPISFRRGDANADGGLDLSDPVFLVLALFAGGASPACEKSADADANGGLDVTDAVLLLGWLFLAGPPPPEPFEACGPGPEAPEGGLACASFPPCP